jgi:annexin A7/11
MAGMGTKDTALVYRLVRAQWDPTRFSAVNTAYSNYKKTTLEKRVSGETSGNYKETLLLLIAHATKAIKG